MMHSLHSCLVKKHITPFLCQIFFSQSYKHNVANDRSNQELANILDITVYKQTGP